MSSSTPYMRTAILLLFFIHCLQSFSQDSTFILPKGFIDSMSSREAERGHITYLKTYYSQCMIGDSLNIKCPQIKQIVKLDIAVTDRMADLSWIKYFDNLTELKVNYNFIQILPDTFPSKLKKINLFYNQIETSDTKPFSVLPAGLTHLDVSYQRTRQFKKLPVLPSSLLELNASYNIIESLPASLPVNLKALYIQSNRLTALPAGLDTSALVSLNASYNLITQVSGLPSALESLNLSANRITALNFSAFPLKLKSINLSENKLTVLPALNTNLEWLELSTNLLTALPALPAKLKVLFTQKNALTNLPALPASLEQLSVSGNAITNIASLPAGLKMLDLAANQLTVLPGLPVSISYLDVSNNALSALPVLPANLLGLNISKNAFTGILTNLPATLIQLQCDSNSFTSLVLPIPSKLEVLTFTKNAVSVFPLAVLPATLYKLHCANNGLTSIPQLPEGLAEIQAKGNAFTCLPNLPQSLGYTDMRIICNKNCWLPEAGNWSVPSNWSMEQVPSAATDVIILNASVQISTAANVKNIDIRTSEVSGTGVLHVSGNISNNSSYFHNEVHMSGTASQLITEARHAKLTISNPAGVKIGYTSYIDVLSVPAGYVENNTFIQNIRVGRLGYCHSGTIVKNTVIETAISVNSGWLFLSNNVRNQKFDVLSNSLKMGFGGSNQTVYKYNGQLTVNNGWLPVAGLSESFTPGSGYRVYAYNGSQITFAGVPFTGPENLGVTFNAAGYDGGGWNLVGNPYMSPVDWSNATGWNRSNIDNAIYIWNAGSGKYASYVNGAATNGGSQIIATGQAFFVKASAANPSLQIKEEAKSSGYARFLRTTETPSLKIILSDAKSVNDEILLRVIDGSSNAFDSEYDAHKLIGEGHNVSISGTDKLPLSISSIPLSSGTYPLEISAEKTGRYTFRFEGIDQFAGTDVYLEDSYLNKTTLIETGTTYAFNLEALTDASRFRIQLTNITTGLAGAQKNGSLNVYPNPTKDNATLVFPEAVSGELVLTDVSGEIVYTNSINNADSFELPMENYKGVYFLKVVTGESIFVTKIVKL